MRSLIPWRSRSADLFEPFRQDMVDMFQRFFQPLEQNGQRGPQAWMPRVDIKETDKEIVIKADLPGIDAEEVEVSVMDGVLILRGEKEEEKKEEKEGYCRVERFAGQFYREILLPTGAKFDEISASSSRGVVTITVPKKLEAQSKRIAVVPQD